MYKVSVLDKRNDRMVLYKYCNTYPEAKEYSQKINRNHSRMKTIITKVG